jgi:purine-binding chemotaxis protein CheW
MSTVSLIGGPASPREAGREARASAVLLVSTGGRAEERWLAALPLAVVVETMRPLPVRAVPGAPSFVRGLSLVRGAPVPVVDLAAFLGSPSTARAGAARFVTLRAGDRRRIAIDVAEVVGVRRLDAASFEVTPPLVTRALPDQVERLGTLDGEALAVLGSARLLPEAAWSLLGGAA